MSDGELMQRMEAIHTEQRAAFIDLRRDLAQLKDEVKRTNGSVQLLQIWQAEVRGSLRMLSIMVGIGIAVPGSVGAGVAILVATGVIR
jgi:hypothetical protein